MKALLLDIFHFLMGGSRICPEDRIAMKIASRKGLVHEYKTARRQNMRPLEALDEWDLVKEEERELFGD